MTGDVRAMLNETWTALERWLSSPLLWAEPILQGLFFLVFGGLLGSFLNVVAYRVPRGRSVRGRRSHCPACGAMIRGRDNVPVLGWLLLGGRCHACRGWISARYPIVEAIMAGSVMLLAVRELASNGANLPGGSPGWPDGPDLVFVHASWHVMAVFAWHIALLATLVVWALFALDGHRPTMRGSMAVLICMAMVGLVFPGAVPLNPVGDSSWTEGLGVAAAVGEAALVALVGAAMGMVAGAIPAFLLAARDAAWVWRTSGGLIGVVLGWQAAVAAVLIGLGLGVVWCGLCLVAGGWRQERRGCWRTAPLALPIAAVIAIGWWQQLIAFASSWLADSILLTQAGTLVLRHELL